jgi:DNA-binding GntR family transcriptional regulator
MMSRAMSTKSLRRSIPLTAIGPDVSKGMTTTISDHIKRDLSGRIDSGLGPPANLTLDALARHYGVSFSPVREAVRGLVSEGVLAKGENGRLRINTANRPDQSLRLAESPTEPPNRAAELEAVLASEVIARSLRRDANYLREEATAQRLGVGRTAIRQVLGRLAGRGLVEHVPRCGWRVRPFDEADLDTYLEVREVLELKALDLARPRLDRADLQRMLKANAPTDAGPRLDNDLHRYLVERAGNRYIRDFFAHHGAYFTTLLDFAAPETQAVAAMAREHRSILRALIDGDWERARETLAGHIRGQKPIVHDLLLRLGQTSLDSLRDCPIRAGQADLR